MLDACEGLQLCIDSISTCSISSGGTSGLGGVGPIGSHWYGSDESGNAQSLLFERSFSKDMVVRPNHTDFRSLAERS
jgi:hypothetical protein